MELQVTTMDGKSAGSVKVSEAVFGLEPRADILQRMVRYQLARRHAGTHKTKRRSEIRATGKKAYRQKGTGSARHGAVSAPLFRGGGKAFGPLVRSHAVGLPKRIRRLALRHALSAKVKDDKLIVVDEVKAQGKTRALRAQLDALGIRSALIIAGDEIDEGVSRAARNVPRVDVLTNAGINVYDVLRRDTLVLSRAAVDALEARFT